MIAARRQPLLGREAELGLLRLAAAAAADGVPALVVLRGESGLGKTRLAEELLRGLRAAGWTVGTGTAVPIAGPQLPYAPWKRVLRALGTDWPSAADPLTQLREAQVGEYVLDALDRAQEAHPVTVVLDDLQWADASSLTLLAHVAGELLPPQRVLLVLVMRVEQDTVEDARLRDLIAELVRRSESVDCRLPALPDEHLRALVDAATEGDLPGPDREVLVRRAHGNPFAALQLATAARHAPDGVDAEVVLPDALREVLTSRLRRFGPTVARLVGIVALAGTPVRGALLDQVAAGWGDRADPATAVAAGLLAVDPTGRFVVTHPLLQQVAADAVLPTDRDEVHAHLAEALAGADLDRTTALALVAHHRLAAGQLAQAVDACTAAAAACAANGAHEDAYVLLDQALDRAGRHGSTVDEPARQRLRDQCAREALAAGQPENAVRLLRTAIAEDPAGPDSASAIARKLRLARALRAAGEPGEAMAVIAAAWAGRDRLTGAEQAEAYAAQAAMTMVRGGYREAARIAGEGLDLLEADPDRHHDVLRSDLLNTMGTSQAMVGAVESGLARLAQARDLARAAGDVEALGRAHNNLAFVLQVAGRTRQAADESLRGLAAAREAGMELSVGGLMLSNAVEALVATARWDEAGSLVEYALERRFPAEVRAAVHQSAAQLGVARGDAEQAAAHLQAAQADAAAVGSPQFAAQLAEARAGLATLRGDPGAALDAVWSGLDEVRGTDDDSVVPALVAAGLRALSDLALHRRVSGEPPATVSAEALWAALEPLLAADPVDGAPLRAAELALCRLERLRLTGEDDAGDWSRQAEDWVSLDRPQLTAYSLLRSAEAAVRQRPDREAAAAALDRADRALAGIGPSALAQEVEALRRRARLDVRVPSRAEPPSGSAPAAAGPVPGLTAREKEVLNLLTEGFTNRRIARQLFISEKTASVHVSNIMGKLHATNRGEAAAVARRLGLLAVM